MDNTTEQVEDLGRRWVAAELAADIEALDEVATDDFVLVGPLGFVVDKDAWLDRHRSGKFRALSLAWTDVATRRYGDTVVSVGVQDQQAEYDGQPAGGRFRTTHIAVRSGGEWRLAGMHVSPIAAPPQPPTR